MTLSEVNMESLRAYIRSHPKEQSEILHSNLRYIFFKLTEPNPVKGSLGVPLSPERSIAIDHNSLPWQLPTLIETEVPTFNSKGELNGFERFTRFMLPQDSGSAIKGAGRVDIFCGGGQKTENRANHMKRKGKLYFLLKKR